MKLVTEARTISRKSVIVSPSASPPAQDETIVAAAAEQTVAPAPPSSQSAPLAPSSQVGAFKPEQMVGAVVASQDVPGYWNELYRNWIIPSARFPET